MHAWWANLPECHYRARGKAGLFEATACAPAHDRQCAHITQCTQFQEQVRDATPVLNRRCRDAGYIRALQFRLQYVILHVM